MTIKTNQLLSFGKGNAKLDSRIYTFNLPAGTLVSKSKIMSCKGRSNYRRNNRWHQTIIPLFLCNSERFESVRDTRHRNFDLVRNKNEAEITALILASLPGDATIVRLHVSGDFFNLAYAKAWMNVAVAKPDILFYGYTKSVSYIKPLSVPTNMVITFSLGGKEDHLIDETMQTARVVFSQEEALELNLEVDHDDTHAMTKGGNFAILLHGTQPAGSAATEALKKLRAENITYSYPRIQDENISSILTTQVEAEVNMSEICADTDKQTVSIDPTLLHQHPDNKRIYSSTYWISRACRKHYHDGVIATNHCK